MAEAVIAKRPFHAFLSHAHVDKGAVDKLYHFLVEIANIPVWYDAVNMPPGATIADSLFDAIENSRAAIILLSHQSVSRGWVQQEYRAALNHQTQYPGYRLIPLRLDDVQPPDFLQNFSNTQIDPAGLDSRTAAHLLKALYQPSHAVINPVQGRHTYISRGWHSPDFNLAERTCGALSLAGLRLVGDAPDQPSWLEKRVAGIMESCGAFAAVLPHRPGAQFRTSKYILREWEIAIDQGLPCLVIPHREVDLPPEITDRPGLVAATEDDGQLLDLAVNLADEWRTPRREPFIFYATDFGSAGREFRALVRESIEAVTGLPCRIGEYVEGTSVQNEILRMVSDASMVIADISDNSANVYIEIGAARAAGAPFALLRKGPAGRPPFMLRDQQVHSYESDAEAVARAVRASYAYRRFLA